MLMEFKKLSFQDTAYPARNYSYVFGLGTSKMFTIGAQTYNGGSNYNRFFNGSMSHINFIDGTAYDASYFGETDATTGEWKIKTSPSVTYGTNGFFILKDGNSGTDQSGNSNNFTVGGGTLTKTEDNPSNVFATINPLDNFKVMVINLVEMLHTLDSTVLEILMQEKLHHATYFSTLGVCRMVNIGGGAEVKLEYTNSELLVQMAMRPTGGVTYLYDDATSNLYYPFSNYYYINGTEGSSGSGDFDNTANGDI